MADQLSFEFETDGCCYVSATLPDFTAVEAVVANKDATVRAKSRAIAAGIADLYRLMLRQCSQQERRRLRPFRMSALKTLRELARSVFNDNHRSDADILDFEGPKFRFALGRVIDLFEQALRDSGVSAPVMEQVLCNFEAGFACRQEHIRAKLCQIAPPPGVSLKSRRQAWESKPSWA